MKKAVFEPKNDAKLNDQDKDQILKEIEQNVQKVGEKIQAHFHSEFEKAEIQQLSTRLVEILKAVSTPKAEDLANSGDLAEKIESCFGRLQVDLKENVRKIRSYNLKTGDNGKNPINDTLFKFWRSHFYELVEHLEKWAVFVNNVYSKLSEYEIQKDTNVIQDWGIKRDENSVAVVNFGVFLEKIKQHGVGNELNGFKPDDSDLRLLNDALNSVVNHKTQKVCEESKLTVKGDFIKLSDVKKEIDACAKDEVQVFAFNRIFIDDNIEKTGSKLKLSIVAPTWQVIGDHQITLVGQNGKDPDQQHANDGQDGAPGLPGEGAGAFFGLNKEILDGEKLKISSVGGKGGRGQDGGDIHGDSPSEDSNHYSSTFRCGEWPEPCNNHDGVPDTGKDGFGCHGYCSELDGSRARCNFSLFGKKSADPKSGGKGGLPGKGGEIQILGGASKINAVSANGADGDNGKGGKGIDGNKIIVDCFRDGDKFEMQCHRDTNYTPEFRTGKDGDNEKDRAQPSESVQVDDKPGVINNYKVALRERYDDRFKRNILTQFHGLLDSNNEIKGLYRTLDFANELKGLEEQQIKGEMAKENRIYFYDCLLKSISEYVKNPNENEKSDQHKKALSYVYTSALSKKHNLQTDSDSNLIIDINGHLDLVVQDMNVLKDLQKDRDKEKEMDNKLKVINKLKDTYKEGIDAKVQEAGELIDKQMMPQLDAVSKQMDAQLDKLIAEILKLEKDARRDEEALQKKRAEMKRAMALHAIFGALGFIGEVVGAIFPPAAIVGKVIDAGSSIAEGFVGGGGENELPQGLENDIANLDKKMKILREKNTEQLNQSLDEILDEIKKFEEDEKSTDLKDLSDRIVGVKEKLKTNYNNREVLALIKELKEVLKKKQDELNPKRIAWSTVGAKASGKLKKALDLIEKANDKLEKAGKAVEMGLGIFKRYKDDNEKLKKIDEAIEQEQEKILRLRQFEDEVYDTIRPMLGKGGLADELNDVANQLKSKSQVSLDIAKFHIIAKLKDIKLTVQQVTQGFEMNADIARCIEKQEEAMTTIINIYDRIQNYQSEKKLANYIAAIASVSASRIVIGDPKLNDKVNELEIVIRSNMVLKEYETATTALKQWTFPFASIYLSELKLPNQLQTPDLNLDGLVAAAAREIEVIKRKLLEYKTSIQHQDRYIHNGEFNSDYVSTRPFFVFEKGNYTQMITDLFGGKEVTAKADILDGAHDKDAIKFNLINVNFKIGDNETRQAELNDKLRGFLISATHMGNSFYRAGKKIYSISGQSQTIEYSFEKNKKTGEPLDQNYVYQKIKNGDLMLSPYSMWKLKLLNATEKIAFADLGEFADQVDMELIGFGSYLAQDVDVSSLNIDEYYKADDTVKYEAKSVWDSLSFVKMFRGFASSLYGRFVNRNVALNKPHVIENRSNPVKDSIAARATFANDYQTPSDHLKLEAHNQTNLEVTAPIDPIGNLVLAQVAVGKIFGENKYLSNRHYLSPHQEQALKTNELASKILPALEMNFENDTLID